MVGEQPVRLELDGEDVHTRCGIVGAPVNAGPKESPHRYTLLDSRGNQFFGTTLRTIVSCKKCSNLITHGKIHGKRTDGFDAGWAARKKTELEMAFGLDKSKAE